MLVAIGVAGEIQFSWLGFRRQRELTQRERKRLGEANERAAEANAQAKRAQLELERFKAPRTLTTEQHAAIREGLRPFAGTQFDTGMAQGSGEQADFLWQLHPVLVEAGWQHVDWSAAFVGQQVVMQGPTRPISGAVGVSNVEIHLHPETRNELLPAATALIDALNAAGIATREVGFNTHNANPRAIHVLVGEKRG